MTQRVYNPKYHTAASLVAAREIERDGALVSMIYGVHVPGEAFYQKLLEEALAERDATWRGPAKDARGRLIHAGITAKNLTRR